MSLDNGAAAGQAPLAIIGIGCLFPKAGNARAYWLNIKNGVDGIGSVPSTHWNPDDYLDSDPKSPDRTYAARGGFLDAVDFHPLDFGIAPNDLEATDTSQLLGLVAAKQALLDAGYGPERDFDRNRVSVILGVTGTLELVIPLGARLGHPRWKKALANAGVPDEQARQVIDEISDSYVGWKENSFPGLLGNVVAGRIANRLDLGGTNCVVDAACASSLSAIHLAGLELATGRCDVAVTGGVDTFNDIFMFMCFSKTPALSPTGDAKPFAADGDGTILGEGLGIVVLKRLADAERDGDQVYAVIRGLGTSSDGKGNAIYAPVAAGQMNALRNAYQSANITPDTIEMVEAHGTGTRVGDSVEVNALTEVYRSAKADGTWCALGSVKSQIGHTKAAAGAAGLIKAALALHHKVLPPTIKIREPIDALKPKRSPFYLNAQKRPWIARAEHPRRAAVSAFGFGGSNFHCVLEEHRSQEEAIDWDGDVEVISLSAETNDGLANQLESWKKPLTWPESRHQAAATRSRFSVGHRSRLLFVATPETDLPKLVESARVKLLAEPAANSWRLPEGVYFGAGRPSGKLAVLFPGQGSQYAGMLRDLACAFPAMRGVLADANRVFARMAGAEMPERLSDSIYPFSVFNKEEREEQELRLRQTDVAQPAIGAVSVGALKVLEGFGLLPDAYAGHSYGELPALCAAGCFDAEALHTISRLRGHLMASYHGGDAGCMLAVHAPLHALEEVLREEALDLVVANRNAPSQHVLSGRKQEIERAAACLDRRQVRHARLPVAAAFHSPLVAEARQPFREALESVRFETAQRPVFANTSGRSYPENPSEIRELLAGQLANPVEFVGEIGCMADGGVRTFLEVGPGSTLTKLVTSILSDSAMNGWDAFALDASSGKRSGLFDLAQTLARLAARGHTVDLTGWQNDGARRQRLEAPAKPGLVVPICGANYVSPKAKKTRPIPKSTYLPAPREPNSASAPFVPDKTMQQTIAPRIEAPSASANGSPVDPRALTQALQITQQSLAAFQQLQEQTAQLHRQFLENQEAAQRTLQMLLEQQQALVLGGGRLTLAPARRGEADKNVRPTQSPSPATVHRNGDSHQNGEYHRPVAAPPAQPAPVAKSRIDAAGILLEIVAEKTGYPAEMLTPEMSLDADLGIDSIKRVEIFSTLQERLPEAPIVKPEHLGSLQTLGDVTAFLNQTNNKPAPAIAPPREAPKQTNQPRMRDILFEVIAEKTGYPAEMLNADMALDGDLGIDSIKRVEIFSVLQERLPEAPIVKPEHLGALHTLADVIDFLSPRSNGVHVPGDPAKKKLVPVEVPTTGEEEVLIERTVLRAVPFSRSPSSKLMRLPANATVALVADDNAAASSFQKSIEASGCRVMRASWDDAPKALDCAAIAGLVLFANADHTELSLRAFRWVRHCGPALQKASERGSAVLATITQLDGAFGLGDFDSKRDECSGALAGLAKTASHEWPNVVCKAIDLRPDFPASRMAEVWDECTWRGPAEVGISSSAKVVLELKMEKIGGGALPIVSTDVVLITGGARGVTAAVALAIAERCRPTLVLLGRTVLDAVEPDWLRDCQSEAAIKQALVKHLQPTPALKAVEAEYRQIVACREARANIAAMREAGSKVLYRALDVADADAVNQTIGEVRSSVGPIAHLIHGAGVLADRRIEDLTDDQFSRVYATKVTGVQLLLKALQPDALKSVVLFSSSTGRFGRVGQAAYAAANEALNKIAQKQQRQRPDCKVVALNWGPWDGGMVTPALRKIFEGEGVGTIPLRQGAAILLDELTAEKSAVEVTVIAKPKQAGAAVSSSLHVAFEQEISLREYPVLASHVIDGRPVLPLALHLELLAHAALHGSPGLSFHGVNDLRVLNGVYGDQDNSRLKVLAGQPVKRDEGLAVLVELHGNRGSRAIVHSRAEVLLSSKLPAAVAVEPFPKLDPYPRPLDEIYRRLLFHGPDLAGIERVDGVSESAIAGWCRTAPAPAKWLHQPLRRTWIAEPQVLDGAFQMMILWSYANHGAGCLPCHVGNYRQYRRHFPETSVRIQIRIKQAAGSLVRADIEFLDQAGDVLAVMRNHESVIDENLNRAFRKNRLPELIAADGGAKR